MNNRLVISLLSLTLVIIPMRSKVFDGFHSLTDNEIVSKEKANANRKAILKCSDKSARITKNVWNTTKRKAKRMTISRHYSIKDALLLDYCDCFNSDTIAIIESYRMNDASLKSYLFYDAGSDSFIERHIDVIIPFKVSNKEYQAIQSVNVSYPHMVVFPTDSLKSLYKYYTTTGIKEGNYSLDVAGHDYADDDSIFAILVFIRMKYDYELVLYRILGSVYSRYNVFDVLE